MAEFRHFLLQDTRSEYGYTSTTPGGGKKNSPPRPERKTHAEKLLADLERAEKKAKARQQNEPAREGLQFIPMLFDESSDFELELQQLENTSPGTRIVSARNAMAGRSMSSPYPTAKSVSWPTSSAITGTRTLRKPRSQRTTTCIKHQQYRRGGARYQYASHGLRFSVRRPQETPDKMGKRLSRTFWGKDADGKRIRPKRGSTVSDDRAWDLGETIAVRGSVHSDRWRGTAAQLASSNQIAVYPVTGWWRYRRNPEVVQRKARYSLIVSISTDDTTVDLYAMVANEIQARVAARATSIVTEVNSDV